VSSMGHWCPILDTHNAVEFMFGEGEFRYAEDSNIKGGMILLLVGLQ